MTFKQRDKSYIKIWETHYGPRPVDPVTGKKFEIHHIDGDPSNNDIDNMIAVTIKDHYDIHYSQGDWGACHAIALRMKKTKEEISELARAAQLKKVKDGTHHCLGPEMNRRRIEAGTHHWLDGRKSSETQTALVESGNHHFVSSDWQRENQLRLVTEGKHNFTGGKLQRELVKSGVHHFVTDNPGKREWTCEHCGKNGHGTTNYLRWHGDNCKHKNSSTLHSNI